MENHYGSSNNKDDTKRRELKNKNIEDGGDDEDSRMAKQTDFLSAQKSSLSVVFGGEVVLFEALPYLSVVSLVEKKIVCRQWKEKCSAAILNKGREEKKQFVDRLELRNAVRRYCKKDNRDEIEKIAEEYGYPIGKWDVSQVENFSGIFCSAKKIDEDIRYFNEDIGAWDVGNATTMQAMFCYAHSFNHSLSGWDVSNVKNMSFMFNHARSFNQDLSAWDTSRVTNMCCVFRCAEAFNGDVSAWDTSGVTNLSHVFQAAYVFNGDISAWDTSSATRMEYMFYRAAAFDGDISGWNVSRVTNMLNVFAREDEAKFNQDRLNLIKSNWERQGKRWWFL